MSRLRIALIAVPLVLLWLFQTAVPAASVTKSEVDSACADSSEALAKYRAARADADAAQDRYDEVNHELEDVSLRVLQLRDRIEDRSKLVNEIRDRVVDRAVELYMNGGAPGTEAVLFASSIDEAITGQEFLSAVASDDIASVDRLDTLRRELERVTADLQDEQARLQVLNQEAATAADDMTAIMEQMAAAYRQMNSTCRDLQAKYAAQQAAAAAAAAARRTGAAGGVPASVTPGFICPMDPGVIRFRNDWGNPRSGGRTHKGTDIFAPMGQPQYAVADGVVRVYDNRLGGHSIWLTSTYGTAYYYAHLSGWAPGLKTGDRVKKGQVIGYNGNSGNAYGGAPHLHFQIHPNGGSPVNPYPTLKRACG